MPQVNITKVTGNICEVTEVVRQYISSLMAEKSSSQELANIYSAMKDAAIDVLKSGLNVGVLAALGVPPMVADALLGEGADKFWKEVQGRRDIVESVLNMIKNADDEFYFALLYIIANLMIDQIVVFREKLRALNLYIESIETIARNIARLLENLSNENIQDIYAAKRYLESARKSIVGAKNILENSGDLSYFNIKSAKSNVLNASYVLGEAYNNLGVLSINESGNVTLALSDNVKELIDNFSDIVKNTKDILELISEIKDSYEVLLMYRRIILFFPENIKVTNAAAATGLYGKNLDIVKNILDSIIQDMKDFLKSSGHSAFQIQYKRGMYLSNTLTLYRYLEISFGSMDELLKNIERDAAYRRIRDVLNNSILFKSFRDEVINLLHIRIVSFLSQMSSLLALSSGRVKRFVRDVRFIKTIVSKSINDLDTLSAELARLERVESDKLNAVLSLLKMFGIKNPPLFLANGEVISLTKEYIANLMTAASAVKCFVEGVKSIYNFSPDAKEQLFELQKIEDAEESERYAAEIEQRENVFNSIMAAERAARERVRAVDEKLGIINNVFKGRGVLLK